MGKGQTANAGVNWSRYSRSAQLGFTEPYLFDKAILLGGEIYRRDYNSFNNIDGERKTTYSPDLSTGGAAAARLPGHRISSASARATRSSQDKITLDQDTISITDLDGDGPRGLECDPLKRRAAICATKSAAD